jgi:hypothetical protein
MPDEPINPKFEQRRGAVGERLQVLIAQDDDPVSLVLHAHLFIEQCLEETIKRHIARPEALQTGFRFNQKVELAEALEVLRPEFSPAFKAINALRNKVAHEFGYLPTGEDIQKLKEKFDPRLTELLADHEKFRKKTRLADVVLCLITAAESLIVMGRSEEDRRR